MLESFVLELCGSRHDRLGTARIEKFKKSTDNDLRLLPPSKEALHQHIYCASYEAWDLQRKFVEELSGRFQPLWTTSQSSVTVKNFIEIC